MDKHLADLDNLLGAYGRKSSCLFFIRNCLDPSCLGPEISIKGLSSYLLELRLQLGLKKNPLVENIFDQARSALFQKGYREEKLIYTYQEHRLFGSSVFEQEPAEFYKPIGLMLDELTVEESRKARSLIKFFNALSEYFCVDGFFTPVSLELLDQNGRTASDPVRLGHDLNPLPTVYSKDFPYRRR